MKKTTGYIIALIAISISAFWGCKEQADVSMEQIHHLQDTVAKVIPGITAIDIKVTGQKELKVIIGDASLYGKSQDAQKYAAYKAGEHAMLIFGEENPVKSGTLIITKENRQSAWDTDPADGIKIDMKLDSLKEHDEILMALFLKLKR